jgi:3'-phosphoadenosine 5'-phosphosulfate (PAPS) 3'-phosphatase
MYITFLGLGEQCTICVGFSDNIGKPIAGVVYRPIPVPNTWAMGAASENFYESQLDMTNTPNNRGFLTSNGGISKFIAQLINELQFERVTSGGAGNKVLMLLEGKGACYIQDRGVSRWDTCATQAVLEAEGGTLSKLSDIIKEKKLSSYTYINSDINQDFETGLAKLTP